ncbi:MAG: hypothetical protein E7409_01935 [Ruminococcaceae bacterium]|nr:hypothetical protein [Oscillospiraceae bacterium]
MPDRVRAVSDITITDNIALITLHHPDANASLIPDIFARIAERGINVDMISLARSCKSRATLSFTIENHLVGEAMGLMGRWKEKIPGISCDISADNSKLTVQGAAMYRTYGVAAQVLATVVESGGETRLITTADNEISLLIPDADADTVYRALKQQFLSE